MPTACMYGYAATEGWDAATGLGTPNIARILKAIHDLDEQYSHKWAVAQ